MRAGAGRAEQRALWGWASYISEATHLHTHINKRARLQFLKRYPEDPTLLHDSCTHTTRTCARIGITKDEPTRGKILAAENQKKAAHFVFSETNPTVGATVGLRADEREPSVRGSNRRSCQVGVLVKSAFSSNRRLSTNRRFGQFCISVKSAFWSLLRFRQIGVFVKSALPSNRSFRQIGVWVNSAFSPNRRFRQICVLVCMYRLLD